MPNDIFRTRAIGNIKAALAKSEEARKIRHPGLEGRVREIVVEELLRPFLPRRYEIATGKIVDSTGRKSKETDIIVYDPLALPGVMYSERDGMIPIESALLAIEVKTELTKPRFDATLRKAQALRATEFTTTHKTAGGRRVDWELVQADLSTYVFAFDGPTSKTALGWLQKANSDPKRWATVDAVCVLGKGLVWQDWYDSWQSMRHSPDTFEEAIEFIVRVESAVSEAANRTGRNCDEVMGRYLTRRDPPRRRHGEYT